MKRKIKINGEMKTVEGDYVMVFEMLGDGRTMKQHLMRCFYSPLLPVKDEEEENEEEENEEEKIWVQSIFFVQSKEEVEK